MTSTEWSNLCSHLQQTNNIVSLNDFGNLINKASGYNLSLKEKEFIYEVYKSQYDDRGNKLELETNRSNTIERK